MSSKINCIGIDIGSTTASISVFRNKKIENIPNPQGNLTIPAYITITPNSVNIGEPSLLLLPIHTHCTFFALTRLMACPYDHPLVQSTIPLVPFLVKKSSNGFVEFIIEDKGGSVSQTPESLLLLIFIEFKKYICDYLGCEPGPAVLTVPAYFGDFQRMTMREIGKNAGFNVQRIINKATSALFGYNLDDTSEESSIIVYDLGLSANISLIVADEGIFEIIENVGQFDVIWEKFDQKILEYLFCEQKVDKDMIDISIYENRRICEIAKKMLSNECIKRPNIYLNSSIIEKLCVDLLDFLINNTKRLLQANSKSASSIKYVVLTGGHSKIPIIQRTIQDFFPQSIILTHLGTCASSNGAAKLSNIITNPPSINFTCCLFMEYVSLSIGLKSHDGFLKQLIPKNSHLPYSSSEIITTAKDFQTTISLEIYEGERIHAKNCNLIAILQLSGIQIAESGIPRIKVTFELNFNEVLTVTAQDLTTKVCKTIIVGNERFTEEYIKRIISKKNN